METLQKSPVANKLLPSLMVKASNAYGDVAKNVKMPPEIERQMARTSLRSILKQVAKSITPADVQQLNAALDKIKKNLIYLSYAHALSQFKLLFCVTLLNTLSEEKKESGEPYRFGKILRAHYIFSLFYPGVRGRLLAFIVAFAALLLFGSALVMSSSTGHCMACLSISAKTSRTVCREQRAVVSIVRWL